MADEQPVPDQPVGWRYSQMGPLGKPAQAEPQKPLNPAPDQGPAQFEYATMKDIPPAPAEVSSDGRIYPSMGEVPAYTRELLDLADRGDIDGYANRIKEQLTALGATPQEMAIIDVFREHANSKDPRWAKWGKDMAMWLRDAKLIKERKRLLEEDEK